MEKVNVKLNKKDLMLYHKFKPNHAFTSWFYCENCCKNLKVTAPGRHIDNVNCDTCSKRMEFYNVVSDTYK